MNSKSINKKTAFSKTYLLFFLSLLICIAAGLQLTKSLGEHALEEVVEKVELASSALIGYVDNELEEVQGLVKVMAHSPWMFPALTLRDSDSIAKANSTLDRYGSSFRVSVAYLMDFDGIVVASSNRHLAESFVGKSYKFRPYFQKAVKGKCGEYFALGATSGKRGYYASYPVKDYSGNVVGVAVIKKNLDHIEQLLSKHEHSYFIDENGIIFLSGDEENVLRSLWPVEDAKLKQLISSRQFGAGPFVPLLDRKIFDGEKISFLKSNFYVSSGNLSEAEWSLVIFEPLKLVYSYELAGIIATFFVCVLIVTFFISLGKIRAASVETERSEDRFREVALNSRDWIWEFDKDGRFTYSNDGVRDILGYEPHEVIGKFYYDFLAPDDKEEIISLADETFAKRDNFTKLINKNVHKSGRIVWHETSGSPIFDSKNKYIGYRGIDRDITLQKIREIDIVQAKDYAELLFDVTPSVIFTVDLNRCVTSWNKKAEEITGFTAKEVIGKQCMLFAEKPCKDVCGLYSQDIQKPITARECVIRKKDGTLLTVTKNVDVLKDKKGNIIGGIESFEDITERKKVEKVLQESERKYKNLYDSSRDAIMIVDPDKGFLSGNLATLEMFRCKEEQEFMSKSPGDLSPEYQPDGALSSVKSKQVMEIAMEKGSHFFEWKHMRMDGEEFLNNVLLTRIELEGKKVFQATVRDITERKRAEEEIRKVHEFDKTLLGTIPFGMDVVDEHGTILFMNDNLQTVFGSEAIGKRCWELYRDDKKQCINCPLKEEIHVGDTKSIETVGVLGGRSFQITHTGMLYEGKKAILEIFEDITERKKAEENIRKLSVAIEQSPATVVITDKEGSIEYVNPKFVQLTGYTFDEAFGQNPRVLKTEDQPKEFYKELWDTIAAGKEWRGEFHNKKKSGEQYWEYASISPIRNSQDEITHFIAVKEDITERKKANEDLKKAKEELEEQSEGLKKSNESIKTLFKELEIRNKELLKLDTLKSDFVSTVSHELRTPLTVIREGTSLMNDKVLGEITDQQKEILCDILDSSDRLAKIINDLLDISKLESGKIELDLAEVDTSTLIIKLVKELQVKAKPKQINLKDDVPDVISNLYGDRDRLIQVLTNLIGNAVKFTPEKGEIVVSVKETDDFVEIAVSDSGRGISKDDMKRLFSKFQQFGRTPGAGEKGTGLGLAISKNIVELHNGQIWAESEIEKGTTFYFTIPRYEAPEVLCSKLIDKQIGSIQKSGSDDKLILVLVKIDNFNEISSLGDEASRKAKSMLDKVIHGHVTRTEDAILPFHSDKIAVVLPDTDMKGAVNVCDKIKTSGNLKDNKSNNEIFDIKLRFGISEFPSDAVDARGLIQSAEAKFLKKKKILIIDDHPQIVRLLSHRLGVGNKFDCLQAFDGEEGVNKAIEEQPDLIICDIVMPKMNGYEVVGHLKENEKTSDIPIIILTAHKVKMERFNAIAPGSIPVLTKTAGFEMLMEVISRLI